MASRCTSPSGCSSRCPRCTRACACEDPEQDPSSQTSTRVARGSVRQRLKMLCFVWIPRIEWDCHAGATLNQTVEPWKSGDEQKLKSWNRSEVKRQTCRKTFIFVRLSRFPWPPKQWFTHPNPCNTEHTKNSGTKELEEECAALLSTSVASFSLQKSRLLQ